LAAAVGDHFVYIHIELSAAAGHPYVQRKHVVMLPSEDLVADLNNQVVALLIEALARTIGVGGALLQDGISRDHFAGNQVLPDAEMLERPLCLRTPELIRGHFNHAEAICFLSHIAHSDFSLLLVRNSTFVLIRELPCASSPPKFARH